MILTLTLNPAIDCTLYSRGEIAFGEMNRMEGQELRFSGKGVNVSYVLRGLGEDSVISGIAAGFTGDALIGGLEAEGFETDFVRSGVGNTRVNVKLPSADPRISATELNSPGPEADAAALTALVERMGRLRAGDTVVIAGSLPSGVGAEYVGELMDALPLGVAAVCDLTGAPLEVALKRRPLLVKPNREELCAYMGKGTGHRLTAGEVEEGARMLLSAGAENVLVTLGGDGAYYASAGECGRVEPPPMPPVGEEAVLSSVGCGDSAVAGWICGYGLGRCGEEALGRAGLGGAHSRASAAARLAVLSGTVSFVHGFPADTEKIFRFLKKAWQKL